MPAIRWNERSGPGMVMLDPEMPVGLGISVDCVVVDVSDEDPIAALKALTDIQKERQREALNRRTCKQGDFTAGPSLKS